MSPNESKPRLSSSAVFVGCAKDCAAHLPGVCENIERLAGLFADSAVIFLENDSTDATKEVLRAWVDKRPNARVIDLDGLQASCRVRTIRLAELRNTYLKHVRREMGRFDYLIVLDCDEVNEMPISCASFMRALEFLAQDSQRAGVFANQLGTYYDLWALRHARLCPSDVWEEVLDHVTRFGGSDAEAFRQTMKKRAFSLEPDSPPLEVDSAFGGLGIYKMSSVLRNSARYSGHKVKVLPARKGPTEVGWQVCEHVSFNQGFRRNGEALFVLPFLINWDTGERSFPQSGFRSKVFDPRDLPLFARARRQSARLLGNIARVMRGRT